MPSQMMDRHSISRSHYLSRDLQFSAERQIGFWKPDTRTTPPSYVMRSEAMTGMPCSIPVSSSPTEKLMHLESRPAKASNTAEANMNINLLQSSAGTKRDLSRSLNLWGSVDLTSGTRSNSNSHFSLDKHSTMSSHYENGLFSSSLSELFIRKLKMSENYTFYGHSVDTVSSPLDEEEHIESLEEIEAQTIGNLLPDDDDLLSGVVDGHKHAVLPSREDVEELDLFSNIGGMELGDDVTFAGRKNPDFPEIFDDHLGGASVAFDGEHPSRTLFVRNINSNVEDSELQTFFEKYGDIRTLYTACKHRGFVMISYYDIRAAQNAIKSLQSMPLRHRRLDIHYSFPKDNPSEKDVNQGALVVFNLDSSVSNEDLIQIFGAYGEIKEIRDTSHRRDQKYIEFCDIRAADEALCALNLSDVAGKKIKVEPVRPGGERRSLMQQLSPEQDQGEPGLHMQGNSTGYSIISTGMDSDSGLGTKAVIRTTIGPHMESSYHHGISSSVPNGLTSLESVRNQSGASESKNPVVHINCGFQELDTVHPHSLPEYFDGLANSVSCNSNGSVPGNVSLLPPDRIENSHLSRISSSFEMGIGSPGNMSGPLGGHRYMWNNSGRPQSSALMWQNSPSFANGLCSPQPQTRVHSLTRSPSHMVNSVLPMHCHHVGSAPIVNPSLWDRRNSYPEGSLEASGFHQGPLGSMRLSGSHLHHMDFVSRNMLSHVGGNIMDLPISTFGYSNPRSMMYSSRGQMSVDPPNERSRNRRNDGGSTLPDNKKQYELDIDRIQRREDNRTTLMIKNIPNKYTSKMLMAAIDERLRGTYDFIYLPIDFKNKCNVGYAFINMVDPIHIIPLFETFNGKKWEKFNSEKVASIAYARIQGKSALIAHFQNSSLMNEDKRCRPILFHSDGPNAGDQLPFPMGVNIRSRGGRSRSSNHDNFHQESPPNGSSSGESSSCSG